LRGGRVVARCCATRLIVFLVKTPQVGPSNRCLSPARQSIPTAVQGGVRESGEASCVHHDRLHRCIISGRTLTVTDAIFHLADRLRRLKRGVRVPFVHKGHGRNPLWLFAWNRDEARKPHTAPNAVLDQPRGAAGRTERGRRKAGQADRLGGGKETMRTADSRFMGMRKVFMQGRVPAPKASNARGIFGSLYTCFLDSPRVTSHFHFLLPGYSVTLHVPRPVAHITWPDPADPGKLSPSLPRS